MSYQRFACQGYLKKKGQTENPGLKLMFWKNFQINKGNAKFESNLFKRFFILDHKGQELRIYNNKGEHAGSLISVMEDMRTMNVHDCKYIPYTDILKCENPGENEIHRTIKPRWSFPFTIECK